MTHSRKIKTIMRILVVFTIALIVLIIGFETALLANGNRTYQYVSAQEWVSQRIAKDALMLQYGNASDHIEAINELQNMLPYFEANHAQITGSAQPDAIETLIRSASVDYTDIDTAAKKLLSSPDKPADPVQVRIILDHERSYFLTYTQINSQVIQSNTSYVLLIFSIIIGAKIILIASNSVLLYLLEKKVEVVVSPGAEREETSSSKE